MALKIQGLAGGTGTPMGIAQQELLSLRSCVGSYFENTLKLAGSQEIGQCKPLIEPITAGIQPQWIVEVTDIYDMEIQPYASSVFTVRKRYGVAADAGVWGVNALTEIDQWETEHAYFVVSVITVVGSGGAVGMLHRLSASVARTRFTGKVISLSSCLGPATLIEKMQALGVSI